jgi:hypothetical protein
VLLVLAAACEKVGPARAPGGVVATCMPPDLSSGQVCPEQLCGNGAIDTCSGAREECDGNQLGGASCASLGYAGGSLSCNAACAIDRRACESCSTDARVTACGHLASSAPPVWSFTLATSDSEIAVAWAEFSFHMQWHFTRFRSDGTMVSDTPCLGADPVTLSLIAMPAGWLVAVESQAGPVELTRFDANGAVSWTSPIGDSGDAEANGGILRQPQLVSGPGKQILFAAGIQGTGGGVFVEFLDADGRPTGNGTLIPAQVILPSEWTAVGVDDGFALAGHAGLGFVQEFVQLVHLALDGTFTAGGSTAPFTAGNGFDVSLAWSGSELRILYLMWDDQQSGSVAYLQRATRDGAFIGGPETIDPAAQGAYPIVATSADTVILHDGVLQRWTGSGPSSSWTNLRAIHAPFMVPLEQGALAQQNGDVIVAWGDQSIPLSFERVHLTP